MAENINIAGRLHSTATGNVVAGANEIYDDAKGKKQSVVNQETDAALDDRYTKSQTYNKTELNSMITTPNQEYVSVTATDQTTAATDVLPATGAADKVYRVGNWDGTQYDETCYSEYAWKGDAYIHLSTKPQIGEVFDISAYHATGGTLAKYADLAAALDSNNGGGVPQSLQKGGMSVKFVRTSDTDNKYVQYFLAKDEWSATTSDWEKSNLQEETNMLTDEVYGQQILSYSGAQGYKSITELESDAIAVIDLSGDIENLREISFSHDWGGLGHSVYPNGRTHIVATIPATCNTVGFIEVTGTTLNISATIKINGLNGRMSASETDILELQTDYKELDIAQKGLAVEGTLSYDDERVLSSIKSIGYYDPDNADVMYIRMLGFFSTFIQITLTHDKSTMIDFREDATVRPTGIKTHHLFNGEKELIVTIDWDLLNNNFSSTNYKFIVKNGIFTNIVGPIGAGLQEQINDIREEQEGTLENIGYNGTTTEQSVPNTVVCPVKKASKNGKIKSIYLKSSNTGKVTIYVGEVDQLYLFVARKAYEVDVVAGDNNIDVSDRNIFVYAGEQVAVKYNGNRFLQISAGQPEADDSFYYGDRNTGLQLEKYSVNNKKIQFGFKVELQESEVISLQGEVEKNKDEILALNGEVANIRSNQNIISDAGGNKYRLMVVNGNVRAFALDFSHILAVGNSYTMHPTTSDTGDLATNLWWGHWAMAASRKETAWTFLLQSALRQKVATAKVTPIFGRRYETGTRALSDNDAFIYWDNNQWQNLKPNVANFNDVDCVLFFLGDNYTAGSGWYDIYKPMVQQFMTWFPNATIICCSCRIREANNDAIAQVANELSAMYISMYGLGGASKLGNYVSGDDGNLHQIDNSAVAGHFGDYGEWLILDRIIQSIGYENNATLYNISITNPTGIVLSVKDTQTVEGAIVSVFADVAEGTTLSGITVTSGGNAVTVTDHGTTAYGRIFTFQMPGGDVSITGY